MKRISTQLAPTVFLGAIETNAAATLSAKSVDYILEVHRARDRDRSAEPRWERGAVLPQNPD